LLILLIVAPSLPATVTSTSQPDTAIGDNPPPTAPPVDRETISIEAEHSKPNDNDNELEKPSTEVDGEGGVAEVAAAAADGGETATVESTISNDADPPKITVVEEGVKFNEDSRLTSTEVVDDATPPPTEDGAIELEKLVDDSKLLQEEAEADTTEETAAEEVSVEVPITVPDDIDTKVEVVEQIEDETNEIDSDKKQKPKQPPPPAPPVPEKKSVNYASTQSGALVLETSVSSKGMSNLLVDNKDSYAISPCDDKKWVVISLSEDILVKQIIIANYERYSSR